MSIRSLIAVLVVGSLLAGCVPEDSLIEDSAGTVSEQSEPALEHPVVFAEFANGDNFVCKSILLVGVSCVGFFNIFPINVLIKDVDVLDDLKLEALVAVLNDLALLNKNEVNLTKILNHIEIAVLNFFIKDVDVDVDIDNVVACGINILGVQQCK